MKMRYTYFVVIFVNYGNEKNVLILVIKHSSCDVWSESDHCSQVWNITFPENVRKMLFYTFCKFLKSLLHPLYRKISFETSSSVLLVGTGVNANAFQSILAINDYFCACVLVGRAF